MDTVAPPPLPSTPMLDTPLTTYPTESEGMMSKARGVLDSIRSFIVEHKWAIVFVIVAAIIAYQLGKVYCKISDLKNSDPFRELMKGGEGKGAGKDDSKGASKDAGKDEGKDANKNKAEDEEEHFEDSVVSDSESEESTSEKVERFKGRCERERDSYSMKLVDGKATQEKSQPPSRSTLASASCPNMEDYLSKAYVDKYYVRKDASDPKDPKDPNVPKELKPKRCMKKRCSRKSCSRKSCSRKPCCRRPCSRKPCCRRPCSERAPRRPIICKCRNCIEMEVGVVPKAADPECVRSEVKRQYVDPVQSAYDRNRDVMGDGSYSFLSREPCNMQTCIPNGKNMGLLPTDLPASKKRRADK